VSRMWLVSLLGWLIGGSSVVVVEVSNLVLFDVESSRVSM
jgi:hypothetical protein